MKPGCDWSNGEKKNILEMCLNIGIRTGKAAAFMEERKKEKL